MKNVNSKYEKVIPKIDCAIKKGQYGRACQMIRYCALHKYDLNDVFYDERLEKKLQAIAENYQIDSVSITKEKVLFYDQISSDNRVLSMHYLNGLMESGYEVIYVYYESTGTNEKIRNIIERNDNVKSYSIGKRYDLESLKKLVEIVEVEKPCKVFSQNHVDDFNGVIFNYALKKTDIERYLINITDHAFWLGQNAYDYIIEFRDYGYSLTIDERKIDKEKLIKLPYYAFQSKSQFKGFDFVTAGKRIIFSGGGVYKTKGEDTFYDIVNHILAKFPDTVFLYLGANAHDYVFSNINEDLKSRVYVYEERDDLDGVMENSYLYINSYPLIGALMTLYASNNALPPFTIFNDERLVNDIHDFYIDNIWKNFVKSNKDQLIETIDYYLNNTEAYDELREGVTKSCINRNLFEENLSSLLQEHKTMFSFHKMSLNLENIRETYRSQIRYQYGKNAFASRSPDIAMMFPLDYLGGIFRSVKREIKKRFNG